MKSRALLVGLNYNNTPCKLNGCINDVKNLKDWLEKSILGINIKVVTDDTKAVRGIDIVSSLNELALQSYKEKLDLIVFHYSGHGSYIRDTMGDEIDGTDECLVPSDYMTAGLITDDYINIILKNINPITKVVCIFDCCHSGTIADLQYRYLSKSEFKMESKNVMRPVILSLSGCNDIQTSADAYNVDGTNMFTGALTSCLLQLLKTDFKKYNDDLFLLLEDLRKLLATKGFSQIPQLCCSKDINQNKTSFLLPPTKFRYFSNYW